MSHKFQLVQPKSKRSPKALHRAAMAECDHGDAAGREGNSVKQQIYLENALRLETMAAEAAANAKTPEPSKSILFHSAGEIAFELQAFDKAERLAHKGLAGDPPPDVAEALRQQLKLSRVFRDAAKLDGVARKSGGAS